MRKYCCLIIGLIALVCSCNGHINTNNSDAKKSDKQAIEKLIDRYVESINSCDTTIVSEIWSHQGDVSFIAPSGHYESYSEIRDSLITGLFGTVFMERNLQKDRLKISINGNSAWAEFYWSFNALKSDGVPHNTRGCETQIFEKDNKGDWRLVHIHYSSEK